MALLTLTPPRVLWSPNVPIVVTPPLARGCLVWMIPKITPLMEGSLMLPIYVLRHDRCCLGPDHKVCQAILGPFCPLSHFVTHLETPKSTSRISDPQFLVVHAYIHMS